MSIVRLLDIIDVDFVNYKVPSMTLMFPFCTFKCGIEHCQNSQLKDERLVSISCKNIFERYICNRIAQAVVFQGFEPFDSFEEMIDIISFFRLGSCNDDIVIYTGYNREEIKREVDYIKSNYKNIVIKFGRYIPNMTPHYDKILGVNLSSDNQYAERVS